MADDFDNSDFFDDALDDLPANTLHELEYNAFLSTQRANAEPGLGTQWVDVKPAAARPPSDYGLDDEEIINLEDQPVEIQEAYDRWSGQHQVIGHRVTPAPGQQNDGAGSRVDALELEMRVLKLEEERAKLQRMVDEARLTAQSKAGEAAVLRQKFEKSAREYEQKISTIRQMHLEAFNKQRAELDAVKRERKQIADANKFLEDDVAREASRVRQAQRSLKDVTSNKSKEQPGNGQSVTPKKSKILPFRDGFDDEDMIISPSKNREKSRPGTPKAGVKRKRPGTTPQESPTPMEPLELSEPRPQPSPMNVDQPEDFRAREDLTVDEILAKTGFPRPPTVSQMALNRKLPNSEDRLMEYLTKFSFPSKPDKKLSSTAYDNMSPSAAGTRDMSEVLCSCLLSLWDQCLQENFHEPINTLVDTIRYILQFEFSLSRKFVSSLVPLCISTIDIIAIPLARASLAQNADTKPKYQNPESTSTPATPRISASDTLDLLYSVGRCCGPDKPEGETFWRLMKFDFVLLMLMRAQPLPQITSMLSLLSYSIHASTFGCILSDSDGGADRQSRRESELLDRISLLLIEKFPGGEHRLFLPVEVLKMRLGLVRLLLAMVTEAHTAMLLAAHKYLFGRLITYLKDTTRSLLEHSDLTHKLKIDTINTAIRFIYTIVTKPPTEEVIDVKAKLAVVPRGADKWLIALSTVAFSKGRFYDEGITTDSMECAHELLDRYLSPDEGEELLRVYAASGRERGGEGMED